MYFNKSWTTGEVSKNQRFTTTTAIFKKRKRPVILTLSSKTVEHFSYFSYDDWLSWGMGAVLLYFDFARLRLEKKLSIAENHLPYGMNKVCIRLKSTRPQVQNEEMPPSQNLVFRIMPWRSDLSQVLSNICF